MDADVDSDSSSDIFLAALHASREEAKRAALQTTDQSKVVLWYFY